MMGGQGTVMSGLVLAIAMTAACMTQAALPAINVLGGVRWPVLTAVAIHYALRHRAGFAAVAAVTAGVTTLMRQRAAREASLRREHDATVRYVEALEAAEAEREKLIASLTRALDDVKTLSGIVPICSSCKRIRDDAGYWKQVESFLAEHTEARFSHGVCPECARRLYPELATTPAPPAKPAG